MDGNAGLTGKAEPDASVLCRIVVTHSAGTASHGFNRSEIHRGLDVNSCSEIRKKRRSTTEVLFKCQVKLLETPQKNIVQKVKGIR